MENKLPVYFSQTVDPAGHSFIVGPSGRGKSRVLALMAQQHGVACDDFIRQGIVVVIEPSEEQKLEKKAQMQATESKEIARLDAVREAYWNASEQSSHGNYKEGLHHLFEYLEQFCAIENPTMQQQKTLFLLLPQEMIGAGISHGFDDSVVRDNLYEYVEENAAAIKEAVTKQAQALPPFRAMPIGTTGKRSVGMSAIVAGMEAAQSATTQAPQKFDNTPDAAVAAIEFSLETDSGERFLHLWLYGEFDVIRKNWPECPEAVFIGADPLYKAPPPDEKA